VVASAGEAESRYERVHEELLALIARQQPVATDLRLAIALLHVNDRAERMAAQCVNIATLCAAVPEGHRPSPEQVSCLTEMARVVDEQVGRAQRAFATRDVDSASKLRDLDLEINEQNRRCFALAVEIGADDARRQTAFFGALMARALERIGDNAVDIGRQLVFVVTGTLRGAPA
jgi:phosphate transport system protein